MNRKFYHKGARNVGTVAQVSTISAYPSLSEGDLDSNWNKCGHDRRSWHYIGLPFIFRKGFGITFVELTFCEVELLQFHSMWALSEMNLPQIEQSGHNRK